MALCAAFLMDPLESIHPGHDSTLALMLECRRRGWEVACFEQRHLAYTGGGAMARMRRVEPLPRGKPPFRLLGEETRLLRDLDVLFLRKDPPVDADYLWATQLAELTGERGPLLVNHPSGLRDADEKLFPLRFPDLCPATLVSREPKAIRAFCLEQGGEAVLKPLGGFGGRGVLRLREGDPNLPSIVETATSGGTRPVLAQTWLRESAEGDKRILLVDGRPAGAVLRVPSPGDFRCNMAAGGRAQRAVLTGRDHEISARLEPELHSRGLLFVGIDVIGRWLTEVNVTSPTGIVEVDALDGVSVEAEVLDRVVERLERGAHPTQPSARPLH
jgi:glutathione synthase